MIIEINPLDTTIFRDGKPFGKSEDTWTNSLILPTPSTIYGALRGTYFSQNPNDFEKLYSCNIDKTASLIIKGIYLCKDNDEILYITPKDCVQKKSNQREEKGKLTILKLKENELTSSPLKCTLSLDEEVESTEERLFDGLTFEDYLQGKDDLSVESLDNYVTIENKIGIGRDKNTKTIQEGLLYRVQMLRYKFKILVEFEGFSLNESGLMRFGGEAKSATYTSVKPNTSIKTSAIKNNLFKLYLLTPAFFKKGWLPSWIDETTFKGTYEEVELQLISCSLGKYQSIGGFDIKENKPKEMLKAVPTGSVYYFKILNNNKEKLQDLFHKKSISDYKQNEGYGITILAEVKL